jgi:hypothetical protein
MENLVTHYEEYSPSSILTPLTIRFVQGALLVKVAKDDIVTPCGCRHAYLRVIITSPPF